MSLVEILKQLKEKIVRVFGLCREYEETIAEAERIVREIEEELREWEDRLVGTTD